MRHVSTSQTCSGAFSRVWSTTKPHELEFVHPEEKKSGARCRDVEYMAVSASSTEIRRGQNTVGPSLPVRSSVIRGLSGQSGCFAAGQVCADRDTIDVNTGGWDGMGTSMLLAGCGAMVTHDGRGFLDAYVAWAARKRGGGRRAARPGLGLDEVK